MPKPFRLTPLLRGIPFIFILFWAAISFAEPVAVQGPASGSSEKADILLEDSMTGDWQKNWFVDGKKVTLIPGENGLLFEAGPVTKADDPVEYHAHHGVLWTKEKFEGDIGVRYEFTRVSEGMTSLLYIHAQGIGQPPYGEDIYDWRELRDIPAMDLYFKYMNLTCLTFRGGEIRARRYPWRDEAKDMEFKDNLIGPVINYDSFPPGKTYQIDVERRKESLRLRIQEMGNPENLIEKTYDLTQGVDPRRPVPSEKGRIGLRNMGGVNTIYKNFQVRRL